MSTTHVSWPSIELFHNVVRTLTHLSELGRPFPKVEYRAKVKLHGTNCAVQRTDAGVIAQSRTTILSPGADYKGFAAWVQAQQAYFAALRPGTILFGEWCGPGVEKGMAVSQLKAKVFAVFAAVIDGRVIYEPGELREIAPAAGAPPELFVLPWEGAETLVDFGARAQLEEVAATLEQRVVEVEREDPWVKRSFGISGVGEGLVFYPVRVDGASPRLERQGLAELMFKAKGEKHRTVGAKVAVSVDPAVAASSEELVSMMLTEARLQQGLAAVGERSPKKTGAFLAWIVADVQKESVAELEAAGLSWSQVEKGVQAKARAWFLSPSRAP